MLNRKRDKTSHRIYDICKMLPNYHRTFRLDKVLLFSCKYWIYFCRESYTTKHNEYLSLYFKGRYSNKKKKTLTAEMQLVGTSELENLNYYTLLDNALKTNEYRNSIPLL